jgi:hypothetical protein
MCLRQSNIASHTYLHYHLFVRQEAQFVTYTNLSAIRSRHDHPFLCKHLLTLLHDHVSKCIFN